jgi:hypothetical protein
MQEANPGALLPRLALITQLSASLDETKATELIDANAVRLGLFTVKGFSQTQALSILEAISSTPGLVGIVARCAKARIIMKYNKK